MAGGAFINGPVFEPRVEVDQIFRLRNPLVPDSPLTTVVIGINRQVVYEESIGNYDGAAVDLEVESLSTYSATLQELDAIPYVDEDGNAQTTESFPHVIFRHPTFGDSTIPKKDAGAGILGWTFSQATGEFSLDAAMSFTYTILTGTADVTATIAPGSTNAGYRTLTDDSADFISAGVTAGDTVVFASGTSFTVIAVINETTLIVDDDEGSLLPPTGTLDDASYAITKDVTDGGEVLVTYVANRSDRSDELITVDLETLEQELGDPNFMNPLSFYCQLALNNTNTSIIALQLEDDTQAGWQTALETLEQSAVPYDLVPLTQDRSRISEIITHVNNMSTSTEAKERRAFINYPLVIQETKAQDDATFNPIARPATNEITVTVLAGNNNLHILGVEPGDIFRDLTENFGGEARIISITPASAAPDASVTLIVATPNTLGLIGTPAVNTITPTAAQGFGAILDGSLAGAGDVVSLTVDGVAHNFTEGVDFAAASIEDDLFALWTTYFGDRLIIQQPGGAGTAVHVRDTLGGVSNVVLGFTNNGGTIDWLDLSSVSVGAGPIPADTVLDGIDDGDTIVLHDVQGGVGDETLEFVADQTTANGSVVGGNIQVQIGGPLMSAAEVRDRIIDAINNGDGTLASTVVRASEGAASPDVDITAIEAGLGDGLDNVTSVTAPITDAPTPGTGTDGGTPLTDWDVVTQALTADQQATQIAQFARDTKNRRIINVWPDQADYVFTDESAGEQAEEDEGIFGGGDVNVPFQANYGSTAALSALRSSVLASTPLTKRPILGPFQLRRLTDTYTKSQLERILSTGNTLMEQPGGAGALVQAVRAVSTDSTDLKVVEENVAAQVDKFTRLARLATTPLFGPNIIDPDGNFFELFSTKVQAVIDRMTNRRTREARRITIIRVYENPARKDSVIMEVEFEPLFGANLGIIQIFV